MGLYDKLREDLKAAMRQGDATRRETIRMALSAITYAEKAQFNKPLDDPGILGVLAKQIKQRRESIDAFEKGCRPDLVAKEKAELSILESYMPRQMTHDEIVAEARRVIEEVGASGPGDKGRVMPVLIGKLKGRAEGKEINEVVTQLLGGR